MVLLKKTTPKVNQENMQVIFPFGPNILCNGYVTKSISYCNKQLIINIVLCNGYVTILKILFNKTHRILYDGYVIMNNENKIIN